MGELLSRPAASRACSFGSATAPPPLPPSPLPPPLVLGPASSAAAPPPPAHPHGPALGPPPAGAWPRPPGGGAPPALRFVLDAVRPDPEGDPGLEEYRLAVALLPLRLRLDQDLVAFLQARLGPPLSPPALAHALSSSGQGGGRASAPRDGPESLAPSGLPPRAIFAPITPLPAPPHPLCPQAFGAAVTSAAASADSPLAAATAAEAAAAGAAGADPRDALPFLQRVDVWGTGVVLDYRPRRVSVAALREGSLLELINLVGGGTALLVCVRVCACMCVCEGGGGGGGTPLSLWVGGCCPVGVPDGSGGWAGWSTG
jgi:hypothetical protein